MTAIQLWRSGGDHRRRDQERQRSARHGDGRAVTSVPAREIEHLNCAGEGDHHRRDQERRSRGRGSPPVRVGACMCIPLDAPGRRTSSLRELHHGPQ